jgi:deoxyribodipyrimidine photo-lyase
MTFQRWQIHLSTIRKTPTTQHQRKTGSKLKTDIVIHWFRRDLRIAGNPGLKAAWKMSNKKVIGLFCFDSEFLSRPDFSHNRFAFFIETLKALKADLKSKGGDLVVIDRLPIAGFKEIAECFKKSEDYNLRAVTYCRDYEPFARQRDVAVETFLKNSGVEVHSFRDHLLLEPHEVLKDDGTFYQVYSPFARKWFLQLSSEEVQKRISEQKVAAQYFEKSGEVSEEMLFNISVENLKKFTFTDKLAEFEMANKTQVTIPIPKAGFLEAYSKLKDFKNKINHYGDFRDFPSTDGTSRLSIYLKNGSLNSAQIIQELNLQHLQFKDGGQPLKFLKEVAWREFYYSIMYHRPDCENRTFLNQYQNLNWENDEKKFEKWCKGETGYPIVDAGMRQLNQTGWMHNRVRMIVASFLVKDLLIDWRWGERYFMKMLLDGDLAPNNGGWQWAASTGCDPQPYFRIFNPWLQQLKFDPEAIYIKKYVNELKHVAVDEIHDPEGNRGGNYPSLIVNHHEQKAKALLLFKSVQER